MVFFFLRFTLHPFNSSAPFQAFSFPFKPSTYLTVNAKWSSKSNSSQYPDLASTGNASNTMINNRKLNAECNRNWTRKSSLKKLYTQTRLRAFRCIDCIDITTLLHLVSFKPTKQHHQGTWLKTFSKLNTMTNPLAKYFSCNYFKIKMGFLVPGPGMTPNCISIISTWCLINLHINVLTIFKIWSVIRIFFSLTAVDNCTNLTLCGSNSFYAVFSIPVSTADCTISDINPGGPAVFPLLIVNFTD